MKISVVGLGLLGGSFALGIKHFRNDVVIYGVDTNKENAELAKKLGIADELMDFEHAIPEADLVILATPVNILVNQVSRALDLIRDNGVVADLGSTKDMICRTADKHIKRGRFVATHPIAGTENSGPESAFATLLNHKMMIVCDRDKSDQDAVELVENLFKMLEMKISHMNSVEHDRHIAWVSHLSHISSFALGATVLDKEKDEHSIFMMAGSGFSSTVRLAKSSPDMWAPIFSQNQKNVSEALDAYIRKLQLFKKIIDEGDILSSSALMHDANEIRRVLGGIVKND